jgi:hypothetical protein
VRFLSTSTGGPEPAALSRSGPRKFGAGDQDLSLSHRQFGPLSQSLGLRSQSCAQLTVDLM